MPTTVHPLTRKSVSYILTMVYRATCFTVLWPIADTTAKSTPLAILHHWIPPYVVPIWVNTDLGLAYTSKIFYQLCVLLRITHMYDSSQNHKSVSRAEMTHIIILTALRKVCAQSTDWVSLLLRIVMSINSSVLSTVGLSREHYFVIEIYKHHFGTAPYSSADWGHNALRISWHSATDRSVTWRQHAKVISTSRPTLSQ